MRAAFGVPFACASRDLSALRRTTRRPDCSISARPRRIVPVCAEPSPAARRAIAGSPPPALPAPALLPRDHASRHQHGIAFNSAMLAISAFQPIHQRSLIPGHRHVVLHIPGDHHARRARAQAPPGAPHLARFASVKSSASFSTRRKNPRNSPPESRKARENRANDRFEIRPFTTDHRHFRAPGLPQKIRPDFRLQYDHQLRPYGPQRPPHRSAPIQWKIKYRLRGFQPLARQRLSPSPWLSRSPIAVRESAPPARVPAAPPPALPLRDTACIHIVLRARVRERSHSEPSQYGAGSDWGALNTGTGSTWSLRNIRRSPAPAGIATRIAPADCAGTSSAVAAAPKNKAREEISLRH